MRMRSVFTHSAQAVAEGALIALLVVGLAAGTTFAAKGGNGGGGHHAGGGGGTTGTGTVNLVLLNGATEAHYGAPVTFTVSTTATAYPYVHLRCYQGGSLVLEGWKGYFPTALGDGIFYLGPTPSWSSGAADCTANLEMVTSNGSWSVLGSTSFPVYQ
jgi:hypothetical protein